MMRLMEQRHDRPMEKTIRSEEQINHDLESAPTAENQEARYIAGIELMMITDSGACPREKTLRQREKFFKDLKFMSVEEVIVQAASIGKLEKGLN
ncbi:MAG: hypothetical protein Q9220_002197 [cf. Caloplaca sp. 1 TL-2023]